MKNLFLLTVAVASLIAGLNVIFWFPFQIIQSEQLQAQIWLVLTSVLLCIAFVIGAYLSDKYR